MTFADLIDRAEMAQQFSDPTSPQAVMYAEMLNVLNSIQAVAYLEPCHSTPRRGPQHILLEQGCKDMREAVALRVFDAIGIEWSEMPHRMHEKCYTCHPTGAHEVTRYPSQEKPRQELREIYQWAGVVMPTVLIEPGVDVVQIGDTARVLAALTDKFETWQVLTKRIADMYPEVPHGYMSTERFWTIVNNLEAEGLVQRRDIATRLTPKQS